MIRLRTMKPSVLSVAARTLPAVLAAATAACTSGGAHPAIASATCASPGMATPGPADMHCVGGDGGLMITAVDPSVCHSETVPADEGCPYGDTMDGNEGDDDDCKYHVVWSSTDICDSPSPAVFTVKVTYLGTNTPLTNAATSAEVFTTTPLDAGGDPYCDTHSKHLDTLNLFQAMNEGPAGTYTGPIYFDQSGEWTVRFHFNENCNDVTGSPHGHAAFHVTVP